MTDLGVGAGPLAAGQGPAPARPDDPAWASASAAGVGVYVHVPFCSHRCGYCDFAAFDGLDELIPAYVDAVVAELAARVATPAATVFVGGGTPSRLPPRLLARLLSAVPTVPGAEVSVEMNPESATPEVLAAAFAAGANRISMGMQSVTPSVLRFLDRRHDPDAVPRAVAHVRAAGFAEVNLDLIYATPGETDDDWRATLAAAVALEPTHISAYALTVESATPLGRAVAAGAAPDVDDDVAADRLAITAATLAAAGYVRYEVSNWARTRPCVHNLRYWSGGPYVGVGCGAHSFDPARGRRFWNHRHPRTYVDAVAAGVTPVAGEEFLDPAAAADEAFTLGMRRGCGVAVGADAVARVPSALRSAGLVAVDGDRIRLTEAGMAVANSVVIELSLALGEC